MGNFGWSCAPGFVAVDFFESRELFEQDVLKFSLSLPKLSLENIPTSEGHLLMLLRCKSVVSMQFLTKYTSHRGAKARRAAKKLCGTFASSASSR